MTRDERENTWCDTWGKHGATHGRETMGGERLTVTEESSVPPAPSSAGHNRNPVRYGKHGGRDMRGHVGTVVCETCLSANSTPGGTCEKLGVVAHGNRRACVDVRLASLQTVHAV